MWDHFHFTGKYRGAAHNECSLAFKIPKFIPIIFHNLSGYDAHLFIKNLGKSKGKSTVYQTARRSTFPSRKRLW